MEPIIVHLAINLRQWSIVKMVGASVLGSIGDSGLSTIQLNGRPEFGTVECRGERQLRAKHGAFLTFFLSGIILDVHNSHTPHSHHTRARSYTYKEKIEMLSSLRCIKKT